MLQIRLLPTLDATILFARRLEASGAALLCIHGRHRTTPREKRVGPAKLDWIRYTIDTVCNPE
jgi:tRNA-dihydrouridine synthase